MRLFTLSLCWVLAACNPIPKVVTLEGHVYSDREATDTLADATVQIRDLDGKRFDKATSNAKGRFSTTAPAGTYLFPIIEGEGLVPAAFMGLCGIDEVCEVEDGALYGVTADAWAAHEATFAGCPGVGSGAGVVGEVRVWDLLDPDTGEHPTTNAAVVELWEESTGETWSACYLDEDGLAHDPEATRSGASAMFGLFGAPPGVYVLSVGLEVYPGGWTWDDSYIYVPETGLAPRFPAYARFPL